VSQYPFQEDLGHSEYYKYDEGLFSQPSPTPILSLSLCVNIIRYCHTLLRDWLLNFNILIRLDERRIASKWGDKLI
jgi:hypothetical protein